MAQSDSNNANAWLLDLPPTAVQRRIASGVVVATIIVFVAVAPFSGKPLVALNALFPSLDAIVFITDLITAVLLFGQFSISSSRPLIALAAGYLFTALIVIPHALTFEGAFSPAGLLGAGKQTGSWLFIFWHFGFSLGLLIYAILRYKNQSPRLRSLSASLVIACTVVTALIVVCALTWLATAGQALLPPIILEDQRLSPIVIYPILFTMMVCAGALALLLSRNRRSTLDLWLAVVAFVAIGELAFSGLLPSVRFSAGFYAGRVLSLMVSSIVLIVLLAEMMHLYNQVVRSNAALQRERDNKLMNMEAMAASIAHEVRQPLTAIATSASAARNWLKRTPADLEASRIAVETVIEASDRAISVFDNVRGLFVSEKPTPQLIDVSELIANVIQTMHAEFKRNEIKIEHEMTSQLPPIYGHRGQLQEVMSNLLNNAIEAIDAVDGPRVVRITTGSDGNRAVTVAVEDSGVGLNPDLIESIFEPFVTTKTQGMGLGLAICRMIIQRHEGRLTVESSKVRGAIFRITLPPAVSPSVGCVGR
jgi:signal transduction histidine kinase